MKKKWMLSLAAAVMCLMLLAGCGSQESGDTSHTAGLETPVNSGECTVDDVEAQAAAYQAEGREWDAWLLVRKQWALDKTNEELLRLMETYPLPAPNIVATEREDGSFVFSIDSNDMSYIEQVTSVDQMGDYSTIDIALWYNFIWDGHKIGSVQQVEDQGDAQIDIIDEKGPCTLEAWYVENPNSFTGDNEYWEHIGPTITMDFTVGDTTLVSLSFGELSGRFLPIENSHGGTIYYTLDGTDPLDDGVMTGIRCEEENGINLPSGTYTVSVRCQDDSGQISDLIQNTFSVSFDCFDSSSNKVAEDSCYEYFTTGSGPLYRCDKLGNNIEVLDGNTTYSVAAFDYYWEPNHTDTMLPEAFLAQQQQIRQLYYLTDGFMNILTNRYYYYDGRSEESFEQSERAYRQWLDSVGRDFLRIGRSSGTVELIRQTKEYYGVPSSVAETLSLKADDGYRTEKLDDRSVIYKVNKDVTAMFEVEGHAVVLDAVYEARYPIILYHYEDSPTEHYVFTNGETFVNEQMTGRTLLGYTENGVYFLGDNGEALREPFDYLQFAEI